MTKISDKRFSGAERAFAVANTPLFLLRKLQADGGVQEISRSRSAIEILAEIKGTLRKEPKGFLESVKPYALLVALSMKADITSLRQATKFSAKNFKWFPYLARTLLAEFKPTTTHTIFASTQMGSIRSTLSDTSTVQADL